MSITDRIDPKAYEGNLEEFLLAHEMKNIAMKRLIEFVTEVSDNFSFQQSDEEGLEMLVYFENKAHQLLSDFGEVK